MQNRHARAPMAIVTAALLMLVGGSGLSRTGILWASGDGCTGPLGALGWQCETLDAVGDVGSLSQFAYGADGSAHVGYTASSGSKGLRSRTSLKYARRPPGGPWSTQVVDDSVGGAQAVLINPVTGRPAIGYGCLKVAEDTGSAWSLQTVVKDCGQSASTFAFDTAGTLYAAYSDKRTWRLNVGRRTGNAWSFQSLTPEASYMSMAIAPDGLPSIAFENRAGALVYGHQQPNGSWQFTTVDTSSILIARVTLRFDAEGAAGIAYRRDYAARFARLDPSTGVWTHEDAFTYAPNGTAYLGGVSFAYTASGPVVTFGLTDGSTTLYAAQPSSTPGVWSVAAIDVLADGGLVIASSADFDPGTGLVGLSYGPREPLDDLKFAEGPADVIGQ